MSDMARAEAQKYERVWAHPEYRRVSPGEAEQERAWQALGCRPGQSLNDYGSGPCRATAWFAARGLDVLGIDHAENACETDVPVMLACLWLMGPVRASDWGYCCDVLEHIPPQHVDGVLAGIAERTRIAAYFRIATRPDRMGPKLIGEPLHLTVRAAEWWRAALARHFGAVATLRADGRDAVFLCRPKEA